MPKKQSIQSFFIIGIFVVVLTIISTIFVALLILAPTVLFALAGLPVWPLLLIMIPISFIILGWVIFTIGGFRRRK